MQNWLQKQNAQRADYKTDQTFKYKRTFCDVLRSNKTQEWIFLALFALSVPIITYYLVVDRATSTELDTSTCSILSSFRIPCGRTDVTVSNSYCNKIHCCYDESQGRCYHYIPSSYMYESYNDRYKSNQKYTPFGDETVQELKLVVNEIDENIVSFILTTDEESEANTIDTKNYEVKLHPNRLMVEVFRTGELLLTTSKGPLISSERYFEWTIHITNTTLFGINQTLITLNGNETFTKVFYKNELDHYSLPIFWAQTNGKFHSVTVKHDGPLEVTILPSFLIILKSLTGQSVEIVMALGPTPEDLHKQLAKVAELPEFWTLGPLTCKRKNTMDLEEIWSNFALDVYSQSNCIDQNLITALIKDNNAKLNTDLFVNISTHFEEAGQRFVLSLPPQIVVNTTLHETAENLNILYQYNGTTYIGKYQGEKVVYPDYSSPNIQSFISELLKIVDSYLDINIDAFILNDNWPEEDRFQMDNVSFHYISKDLQEAMSYTIRWNATTPNSTSLHINDHNSFGSNQIKALETYYTSTTDKPIILTSTKNLDQTNHLVISNQESTWDNLAELLKLVLFNSIVGNFLVSIPVCGDENIYDAKSKEELCLRWYLVAATMPSIRIPNGREPDEFYTQTGRIHAEKALAYRNMFLPVYYTILSRNEPVLRPMFYQFHQDNSTFNLDSQYMIGDKLLVAHPLSPGKSKLQIYLPQKYEIWYEFWGGLAYNVSTSPWIETNILSTDLVMFVAQGTIVPLQEENVINLVIALDCSSSCNATATLLLENYVNFSADNETVIISDIPVESCNYTLGFVKVTNTNANDYRIYQSQDLDLCNEDGIVNVNYVDLMDTPS